LRLSSHPSYNTPPCELFSINFDAHRYWFFTEGMASFSNDSLSIT
jgi:hypothetical protein